MHPAISEFDAVTGLFFTLLIPFAIAGLAVNNAGLGRARSATHAITGSLCAVAVAMLVFFSVGFAFQSETSPLSVTFAGRSWQPFGFGPFFMHGFGTAGGVGFPALYQLFSVALAAVIPLGAGADRWRLSAVCASSALLAAITFPLFSHWAGGTGGLAQLGYVDGGSGMTQALGGLDALAIVWILGPRRGKFGKQGRSLAIPGHNAVLVLSGSFLAWIGWIGLNAAGAMARVAGRPETAALIALNTTLAASAAALAAAAVTKLRFGRPDASLIANAWLCGLASSGAGSAFFAPSEAAATGLAAGTLIVYAVEFLESKLLVDDPAGAISVHAGGGIWGLLCAGFFARSTGSRLEPWLAQLAGIAVLLGFMLPLAYALNAALNRFLPQRVSAAAELQGLDLHELGAGAYPEFMMHSEDLPNRLR